MPDYARIGHVMSCYYWLGQDRSCYATLVHSRPGQTRIGEVR